MRLLRQSKAPTGTISHEVQQKVTIYPFAKENKGGKTVGKHPLQFPKRKLEFSVTLLQTGDMTDEEETF